jgi:O-phospho-L-seryl-tRNASec:L-selenocysteinyl-tRNA synthase
MCYLAASISGLLFAGLKPVVIELLCQGDELVTDKDGIQNAITRLGEDNIVAVVTTTSCFAPR